MSAHSDIALIQRQLSEASMRLAGMAANVGKARMVLSWETERRKCLFSKLVAGFLTAGESAAAAEHKARAHPEYTQGLASLYSSSQEAQKTIAEHDAMEVQWRTAQSLLSLQKAVIDNL